MPIHIYYPYRLIYQFLRIELRLSHRNRNRKTTKRRRTPTPKAQPTDEGPPTLSSAAGLRSAVATHRQGYRLRLPSSLPHLDIAQLHLQRILQPSKQTVIVLPPSATPPAPALLRRNRSKTTSFGRVGLVQKLEMTVGNSNSKLLRSVGESGWGGGCGSDP
ncbi:uncharacterized protein G2W53_040701 [Senna tora]|uniref:Uncharacterized protein n=1 Tax=Senna tora TaxID=362788 RepID=A0A834VYQ7_9FABA|nr:uncharacterized protein G2W53_040701 [Senna tora]